MLPYPSKICYNKTEQTFYLIRGYFKDERTYYRKKLSKQSAFRLRRLMKKASTEGKIPELWNRYFQEQMMHHIPNQQTKETLAFYSNYESDETGTYTFTISMPVSSLKKFLKI